MIFEQCILFEGNMIDAHATLKLNLSVNVEEGWEISVIVDWVSFWQIICSNWTSQTLFITSKKVNFKHISLHSLVFLFLTLSMYLFAGLLTLDLNLAFEKNWRGPYILCC